MTTYRQPSIGRCIGLLASGTIGAFISGITAVVGALMTGFTNDAYGFAGAIYLVGGWSLGALLALITIVTGEVRRWMLTCTVLLSLIGTPLVVLACGAISYPLLCWSGERIQKEREEKSNALRLQLQRDPEIALREKWYSQGNEKQGIFCSSLDSSDVSYTLEQVKRLYLEAPSFRDLLLRHPACDAAFLSEHFQEAYDRAAKGDGATLCSIMSNRNIPRELLERAAVPDTLPPWFVKCAEGELKKRGQ